MLLEADSPTAAQPAVRDGLPAGPRLHRAIQTPIYWTWRNRYLAWCRSRYGDAFTVRVEPNGGTLVVLSDPADVKTVFTGDVRTFHAGEGNSLLAPLVGPRSVLVLDEAEHMRERKLMLPAFHGERIAAVVDLMRERTELEVARWPEHRAFRLHPRMHALTLDIIVRVVIGVDDEARAADLRAALRKVLALRPWHLLVWLRPELERIGPWRRLKEDLDHADRLLHAEIARRRAAEPSDDVLSMLLQAHTDEGGALDDGAMRDELVTLLVAGHETTASALAWAFELLHRHPAALARVRAGLDDARDPYLDAVVKETLRVRPVIHDVARVLTEPTVVAGRRLPAGTTVMPSIGLLHADDANHPDAAAFRPERWLDSSPPAYTWIPFGGGPRRCLGATFATTEMATVLRTTLRALELRPVDRRPEKVRVKHITLVPSRSVRMEVVGRNAT